MDNWNVIEADRDVIDPGDTLADPEHLAHLSRDDPADREERRADEALSDVGSAALARRWRRDR